MSTATLIQNARLPGGAVPTDVHLGNGRVMAIGELKPRGGEELVDAGGATLLPGLHDHHIHLMALAAALESVSCGPPDVHTADGLATLLARENRGYGWLRGIGYHPCVAGEIDRPWLDRHIPHRPVRIQHRGGRLWVLNSAALAALGLPRGDQPTGVEMVDGRPSGRLYECDLWLRHRLGGGFPDLAQVSRLLAGYGITGVTDTSPANGAPQWEYLHSAQARGEVRQRVRMMGGHEIASCGETALLGRGELKIHLLESRLPDLDGLQQEIQRAHRSHRGVAFHCVTRTELVFALAALKAAGVRAGDRIEHASVTPPELLDQIRELGLRVVVQPHFIAERGDQYLADVDTEDQPWLYRLAAFLEQGIALAGGSDAPFGNADPWRAMRAAVARETGSGVAMGAAEALTPEQALALFLSDPATPGVGLRQVKVGAAADLCLLNLPWERVREDLDCRHVRRVWREGEVIFSG